MIEAVAGLFILHLYSLSPTFLCAFNITTNRRWTCGFCHERNRNM